MANRARNNLQESSRNLGKNSAYPEGQLVSPTIEEANNPTCTPLDGWLFQFGGGGSGPAVDELSTVGNAGRVTGATTTVPLLDDQGRSTGRRIEGAVTVDLTATEVALAPQRNLWLRGGTTDDPLLYGAPVNADRKHGFGALRCALDNMYGDNLEWIGYPDRVRHVFCYYFTVNPAPTDGKIVVRKELRAGTDTATFHFNGSVSYIPGGNFDLTVNQGQAAETSFARAAGDSWNFTEFGRSRLPTDGATRMRVRQRTKHLHHQRTAR